MFSFIQLQADTLTNAASNVVIEKVATTNEISVLGFILKGGFFLMVHLSFITFYDQYYKQLYRYVYFKVGNKWDTDDIVSDTFRKAYEKYTTVKDNHASWLFSIATGRKSPGPFSSRLQSIQRDLNLFGP